MPVAPLGPARLRWLVLVAGLMISTHPLVIAKARADTASEASTEAEFVARINQYREANGLRPLAVDAQLAAVARGWATHMASSRQLAHNPDLAGQVTAPWTVLGENVGVGCSVDDLMRAFVASPRHHHVLTNPAYTHVGVGTAHTADGCMYTTHDFMALAPPPPRPAPPRRVSASVVRPRAPADPARVGAVLSTLRLVELTQPDPGLGARVAQLLHAGAPPGAAGARSALGARWR